MQCQTHQLAFDYLSSAKIGKDNAWLWGILGHIPGAAGSLAWLKLKISMLLRGMETESELTVLAVVNLSASNLTSKENIESQFGFRQLDAQTSF